MHFTIPKLPLEGIIKKWFFFKENSKTATKCKIDRKTARKQKTDIENRRQHAKIETETENDIRTANRNSKRTETACCRKQKHRLYETAKRRETAKCQTTENRKMKTATDKIRKRKQKTENSNRKLKTVNK